MKKKTNTAIALTLAGIITVACLSGPFLGAKSLDLGDLEDLGDIMKGAGIAVLTTALAGELDKIINTFTLNKNVPVEADTKVVPIISVGQGTRVGAAQVIGPRDQVRKVKVVMHLETKAGQKNLMIDVFVPSDSVNPLKFQRIGGVGVSALIDFRLSGL